MGGFELGLCIERHRLASDFTQLRQQSAVQRQPLVPAAIALERRQLLGSVAFLFTAVAFVFRTFPFLFGAESQLLCAFALVLGTEPHLLRSQP